MPPDPPRIEGPPAPWLSHSPTFPESAAYFKTFWNLCFTLWLLLTAFFKLQFLIIAVPYYQCLEPRWFQRCPLAVWLDHLLVKLPSPAHKKSCNSSDHCHCFCSKWQASSDVVCPPIPVLEEPTETIWHLVKIVLACWSISFNFDHFLVLSDIINFSGDGKVNCLVLATRSQ